LVHFFEHLATKVADCCNYFEIKDRYGITTVNTLTYLGIELVGGFQATKMASYSKTKQKIEESCNKIKLSCIHVTQNTVKKNSGIYS
jgi:hypothetical protein